MEDLNSDFRPNSDSIFLNSADLTSHPLEQSNGLAEYLPPFDEKGGTGFKGPGIGKASAWMLAFLMVQLIASLLVMAALAGHYWLTTDLSALTEAEINGRLADMALDPRNMIPLICGTLGISAIVNSLLIWWRLGRSGRATLGLKRLPISQAVCIMLMVLPLSMIGSKLYLVGELYWQDLTAQLPFELDLSSLKSMETISVVSNELSLPWMIFLFALLPAVSEELMFRGFIGRGLTERWGRVMGVLLTTWFFAMMHGYPPHMLALIPLSIMIHDVYLVTRNFWAPVLMHFTNNAFAVIMLSLHVDDPVVNAQNTVAISPAMMFASFSCVLALAALIRALQGQSGLQTSSAAGWMEQTSGPMGGSGEFVATPQGQIATMQNHVTLQLDALAQTAMEHIRIKRLLALATISVMLFGIACFNIAAV